MKISQFKKDELKQKEGKAVDNGNQQGNAELVNFNEVDLEKKKILKIYIK